MSTHAPSGVAHFDIIGPQLAELTNFYRGVFGLDVTERGPGYASIKTAEGSPDWELVEQPAASLVIGVVVRDLEQALDLAITHGGSVGMPITNNGWVTKAQIVDPAGNCITVIKD